MAKKKLKVRRTGFWQKPFVGRKYKDELFRMVFRDKRHLLELYNAVNGTGYQNPDELEITTLGDVIYMAMKNDLSFMIGSVMNLYEHQSTFNPNMPIRGLMYFARLYEAYISRNGFNIYGKTLVCLPAPQYIVFYNGRKEQPDEIRLRLSEAFAKTKGQEPALECCVRMLNINLGHNKQLMQGCRRLWEYAVFIGKANENLGKGQMVETAVNRAVDSCIRQGILEDVLVKSRNEVLEMLLTEFDVKKHLKNTYEEGRTEGLQQGRKQIVILNQKLVEEGRLEDLVRASMDDAYREKLLQEYGLFDMGQ